MRSTRKSITLENKGQKIFAVLHEPKKKKKPPIVLIFHGFASNKVGSNRSYVYLGEALAEEGIAVLRFDFRGSGDSEGYIFELTLDDFISDGLTLFSYIKAHGYKDIGFFGSSFGGMVSVMVASKVKKVKTLALWAPCFSGNLWLKDQKHLRGQKVSSSFQKDFLALDISKPLSSLRKVPLLHMQGSEDSVISDKHKKAFETVRKSALAETKFVAYKDEDHSLGFAKSFPKILDESVNWFKEKL